jgi:hypothetical protein
VTDDKIRDHCLFALCDWQERHPAEFDEVLDAMGYHRAPVCDCDCDCGDCFEEDESVPVDTITIAYALMPDETTRYIRNVVSAVVRDAIMTRR